MRVRVRAEGERKDLEQPAATHQPVGPGVPRGGWGWGKWALSKVHLLPRTALMRYGFLVALVQACASCSALRIARLDNTTPHITRRCLVGVLAASTMLNAAECHALDEDRNPSPALDETQTLPMVGEGQQRIRGDVRAVMASPEEAAELKKAAEAMDMPVIPAGSDLDLMLSGAVGGKPGTTSPLAHGT